MVKKIKRDQKAILAWLGYTNGSASVLGVNTAEDAEKLIYGEIITLVIQGLLRLKGRTPDVEREFQKLLLSQV